MEHSITVFLVTGLCLLVVAAGLDFARREFAKKRRDYRMGQALRRGLAQAEGTYVRTHTRVLPWQSPEGSTAQFS